MPRHPEPQIRRAVRVLAIVGELHRRGYQLLRVMPFMSPSGAYWRCWIGPVKLFYRNHGAILHEAPHSPQKPGVPRNWLRATALQIPKRTGERETGDDPE
jgi:hypothetical protein